ncbi:MAPEG family protein [Microbulbifer sp. JTAC008]|uniref:MAPEG family protein n=1 Tax=unclassified Microbulbifer TaxID=2619833 RepID=UPI004039984C
MIESAQIIQPVIALIAWSMVMWLWMYATRLPAVKKAKLKLDPNAPRGEQMSTLPPHVRWKADNYNHLMEQPTIFYALAISLAVLGAGDGINYILAWAYVGIRVIHSIVQATFNKIEIRFLIFALSNIPLLALTVNALRTTFMQ